jgi:Ca-activated chloride channel homolog
MKISLLFKSMGRAIIGILFLLLVLHSTAQTKKVVGQLSSDTADLTILNIFPDAYPNVSVVFKAENRNGEPVWNLTKGKMSVKEDARQCDVISIEEISKNKPINIGLVIDHSGSMLDDYSVFYGPNGQPLFTFDQDFKIVYPAGYKSPMDNARAAVRSFVSTFNSSKDFISVIGFSSQVDKPLPLTQNISQINSVVDSMKADESTALYDAMIAGLEEVRKADGIKVLVALTDGQDNLSKSTWKDVVAAANKYEIPIYIVGLGNVTTDTLSQIAKSTKGQFYFTTTSNSLSTVYTAISKQIQAFYELLYRSPNLTSISNTREIEVSFNIDSIYLNTNPSTANFPAEVVQLVARKEKQRQYLLYGGIALAVLAAAGTLLYRFKKQSLHKLKPAISKVYPNPSNGIVNIEYKAEGGQLQIMNINGQVERSFEITGVETRFDLTNLQNGTYLAVIRTAGGQSNAIKFVIQK